MVVTTPSAEDRQAHLLLRERQVRDGLRQTGQGLLAAGRGLREIRDRELYRVTHRGFGSYVRERHGLSRSRAYQLIDFAEVIENLSTLVDTSVAIVPERVARFLAGFAREAQVAIYRHVLELGPVDLAKVRVAAKGFTPRRKPQFSKAGSHPTVAPAPPAVPPTAVPGEEVTPAAATKGFTPPGTSEAPTAAAATDVAETEFWREAHHELERLIRSRNQLRTSTKRWGRDRQRLCFGVLAVLESEVPGHPRQGRQTLRALLKYVAKALRPKAPRRGAAS